MPNRITMKPAFCTASSLPGFTSPQDRGTEWPVNLVPALCAPTVHLQLHAP
ncbi:hypothetical protein M758_UG138300 [Ceratodon purpureus]|nr:hypothetical protein M758_UG138300 [Ceratodon purpureus]